MTMSPSSQPMGIFDPSALGHAYADMTRSAGRRSAVTYSPYLGMVLQGDQSNQPFNVRDGPAYYASMALAMMRPRGSIVTGAPREAALAHDKDVDYKRRTYAAASASGMELEFTAGLKKELWMEREAKRARMNYITQGGQTGLSAPALNPYEASVPPGGADNASEVVGPLTQIPFIRDVLGFPTEQYFINEMTTKVALPQLHAEMPETDWGTPNLQLEPTQFVENRRPDFDSHFFLAKRNEFAFFIPREYRMRATIDPYNIYVRQASDSLRQAREALTLLALSGLPDQNTGGFQPSGEDLPNPETDSTGGFPAAQNNSKRFYEQLFARFWKNTRGEIDSIVMNPVDFVAYESNFYTNGWTGYMDVSDWGILQMPGFKRRIRVATSPFCPENQQYFFNSRFVYTGEGPMVTETWAKPEANSDAGAYRDYIDVRIFNPRRAGFKAKITGTTPTEITTLDAARALIRPPADLLEKNQS